MPEPNKGETEEQFMDRCMAYPDMQKYEPSQRAAICHSKFREESASASMTVQLAVFTEPMQIIEDSNCCLKVQAVIAKEGVYTFPAGPKGEDKQCLWSRQELLNAARTARAAKIIVKDHPAEKVITSQHDMYGTVEKPFFDRDRIRSILNFDKDVCPQDFLEEIRAAAAKTGPPKDVSIGFYYATDATPGTWHGIPYDLVMRDMLIDHVAAGVWRGRCTFPNCGIGSERRFIAAASGLTVQEKKNNKIGGGKKGLSETKPEEFLEFVKLRIAEGYTEKQAKDYWDAYVGTKELSPLPPVITPPTPPTTTPPTETPPTTPTTPPPTQPPPAPEPELTAEQLIDRSKELLQLREQSVIEKNRADRRHPV